MTLFEFWRLIDQVTMLPFEDRVAALESRLAQLGPDKLISFSDTLHDVLTRLDTPVHAEACHAIGDSFLYIRCAAVLAGSDMFEAIVAEPQLLAGFEPVEAEDLLFAAPHAYERTTGLAWDHDIASEDGPYGWLVISIDVEPEAEESDIAYGLAWGSFWAALDKSVEWLSWWQLTGKDALYATLHLDTQGPVRSRLRKGNRIINLDVHRQGGRGSTSAAGSSPAFQATDDIVHVLTVVTDELGLPPFPPLPSVPPPTAAEIAAALQADRENRAMREEALAMARELLRSHGIETDL